MADEIERSNSAVEMGLFTCHVGLIENIIKRMAMCSFAFKTWAVILLGVMIIRSGYGSMFFCSLFSLIPMFFFWCLDSFYLLQEKKYRRLYNMAINGELSDFTLNPNIDDESEDGEEKDSSSSKKKETFLKSMFSKTEFFFYVPMLITLALSMLM